MQVRDGPATVSASKLHNVTEDANPWEGAVSVEHESGDLLILSYFEILTDDRKAQWFLHRFFVKKRVFCCVAFLLSVTKVTDSFLFLQQTEYRQQSLLILNKTKKEGKQT